MNDTVLVIAFHWNHFFLPFFFLIRRFCLLSSRYTHELWVRISIDNNQITNARRRRGRRKQIEFLFFVTTNIGHLNEISSLVSRLFRVLFIQFLFGFVVRCSFSFGFNVHVQCSQTSTFYLFDSLFFPPFSSIEHTNNCVHFILFAEHIKYSCPPSSSEQCLIPYVSI